MSNLEILIRETGARIEVGDLPTVEADRIQMIQLFQNLIGNGIKFHRESDPPLIRIHAHPPNQASSAYQIVVEDDGIGFDQKHAERIFSPLERLHGRSAYEGVGMGLAICKKIIEWHGGTITARSAPAKGSSFILTLPESQRVRN